MAEKLKLSNNQINKILVAQTTYTEPVGLVVISHITMATTDGQDPTAGIAILRTAPVVAVSAGRNQQAREEVHVPSSMQF